MSVLMWWPPPRLILGLVAWLATMALLAFAVWYIIDTSVRHREVSVLTLHHETLSRLAHHEQPKPPTAPPPPGRPREELPAVQDMEVLAEKEALEVSETEQAIEDSRAAAAEDHVYFRIDDFLTRIRLPRDPSESFFALPLGSNLTLSSVEQEALAMLEEFYELYPETRLVHEQDGKGSVEHVKHAANQLWKKAGKLKARGRESETRRLSDLKRRMDFWCKRQRAAPCNTAQ